MKEKRQTILSILIFTLLVNFLAWTGSLLGGSPSEPGLGFLIWGTAPLLSALVMRYLLRDKTDMGWKFNIRGNRAWYLFSLLMFPLVIAAILVIGLASGLIALTGRSFLSFSGTFLPLSVTFFIFSFFEEVGWRGYLAPRAASLSSKWWGHALVGLIWAGWHLPYMRELCIHTPEGLETLLPRFVLGTITLAVIYGEVRLRTNSLWPAVIMHWSGNTIANTLLEGFASDGFVSLSPEWIWLTSFGAEGVLSITLFAVLGGTLYCWRISKRKESEHVRKK